MRIEHVCERIHEDFENVVARDLLGALEYALIALLQNFPALIPRLFSEHERYRVVLHALPPDLIELDVGLGPRRLRTIEFEVFVLGEIRLSFQQRQGISDTFAVALLKSIEDRKDGFELARDDCVIELITIA